MVRAFKIFWIIFWVILATLVLFLPVTLAAFLGSTGKLSFTFTEVWAWIILKAMGCRTKTTGMERIRKKQSYIIIANHQSHFDALAIILTLGIQFRWVVKKELLKIPLFGQALYASRNIIVDRSNREKTIKSLNEGMDRLPKGVSVMFFAEGSRSSDGMVKKFKKGGFITAIGKKLPILPVTVNDSMNVLPKGSLVFNPGTIEVVVGEPVKTKDYNLDRLEELTEKTRNIIISNQKFLNL